jgi:hypothetical protein
VKLWENVVDSRAIGELDVLKKSMSFVKDVYQTTESFPRSEKYGLISLF